MKKMLSIVVVVLLAFMVIFTICTLKEYNDEPVMTTTQPKMILNHSDAVIQSKNTNSTKMTTIQLQLKNSMIGIKEYNLIKNKLDSQKNTNILLNNKISK